MGITQLVQSMWGKISDTAFRVPRIDPSTNSLQVIDYEHHEVHAGSHYFYADGVTLASAGTQLYLITMVSIVMS